MCEEYLVFIENFCQLKFLPQVVYEMFHYPPQAKKKFIFLSLLKKNIHIYTIPDNRDINLII